MNSITSPSKSSSVAQRTPYIGKLPAFFITAVFISAFSSWRAVSAGFTCPVFVPAFPPSSSVSAGFTCPVLIAELRSFERIAEMVGACGIRPDSTEHQKPEIKVLVKGNMMREGSIRAGAAGGQRDRIYRNIISPSRTAENLPEYSANYRNKHYSQ